MLPEASFVFLDEFLNANSAILNSLLMVLNERRFRRGRESRPLPVLMVVGASNRLPEDDALAALFDRFLLRVPCDNVPVEQLSEVLVAGWELDLGRHRTAAGVTLDEVRHLHGMLQAADLSGIRSRYVELVHRLRHAGLPISDRRAVKLQRLLSASALLCGRVKVELSDLWVLRYIWDTEEQQDVLRSLVQNALSAADLSAPATHPRARGNEAPDAEHLARDLERLSQRFATPELAATEQSYLRDQLGLLTARCQWVEGEQARQFLAGKANELWQKLGGKS
jgi:MoxR-like ATPase